MVAPAAATDEPSPAVPAGWSLVATARDRRVEVRRAPGGVPLVTLDHPTADGSPLTFLVLDQVPGWLHVQLPVRPNGSSGWVGREQVELTVTPFRLVVHRSTHLLEVLRAGRRSAGYPVGLGTSVTPTPAGTYYLTELLRVPDPTGPYGPYAFGLSAFSPTLTTFAGGPGQIGLHGTDRPDRLGTAVSHGCLRVRNDVITRLAGELPLGTPIEITG